MTARRSRPSRRKAPAKKPPGPAPIELDANEVRKLAALDCTYEDVAGWFGVSTKTVKRRMQEPDLRAAWESGKAQGNVSLRRKQWKLAETNAAMAIFLGKNRLAQRDTQHLDLVDRREAADLIAKAVERVLTLLPEDQRDAALEAIDEVLNPGDSSPDGPPSSVH